MAKHRKKLSGRARRIRRCMIGMLMLTAFVFGVWILILDDEAPLNAYQAETIQPSTGTPSPSPTPSPTPTLTPEPIPTPEASPASPSDMN